MEMEMQEQEKILDSLKKFITESSKNSTSMLSQANALTYFSGDFWTEEVCRKYRRRNRTNLHHSCWPVLVNNIVARFTSNAWHISVDDNSIQEVISDFEAQLGSKNALSSAFTRGVVCGAGWLHCVFVDGEPKLETILNTTSVFADPWALRPDCSDANECAVVNFISRNEAEEKYDVTQNYISLPNVDVWDNRQSSVAKILYYKKNAEGTVDFYEIVGDKVINAVNMPIHIIPVLRFAGYERYKRTGVEYEGIVQKTYDLQLVENLAFSTLYSRLGRNVRSLVAMSVQSMSGDGIREGLSKCVNSESFILPYNQAGGTPQILQEHFATDDLQATITSCRTLMEDAVGIKLQGMETDKTATEALLQDANASNSLVELYLHAEMTMRSLAKILLTAIGADGLVFKLENGPAVCTTNMKERQQLASLIQSTSDEAAKQYLVAKYAGTLNDKDISDTLFANLDPNYKVIENTDNEENMIQGLAREAASATANYNEAISVADEMSAELDQAKAENQQLEAELNSNRESWNLEKQRMALDAQKAQMQLELKVQELQAKILKMEAETEQIKAETQAQQLQNSVDEYNVAQQVAVNGVQA